MIDKLNLSKGEGFLLTDSLYRRYFTNVNVAEGYLLIGKETVYFTDARYYYAVCQTLKGTNVKSKLFTGIDCIKDEIALQGLNTIYLDFNSTTLAEYEVYKTFGVKLENGTNVLESLREIKIPAEIDSIKKACEIIQEVVSSLPTIIKKGITESEIANYVKEQVVLKGAQGVSFDTIVAFGSHSAVPHHQTGETRLEDNQVVLIDTGCFVNGYSSDITRTFFFGNPPKEFVENYNAVLNANILALDYAKEGVYLKAIDSVARDYLSSKGIGKFFTHSLGHGVGLAIHEQPSLSKKATGKLKENMVFTIEPGVYFDGEYGIRIEDTVALINGKATRLYTDSKELIIIK